MTDDPDPQKPSMPDPKDAETLRKSAEYLQKMEKCMRTARLLTESAAEQFKDPNPGWSPTANLRNYGVNKGISYGEEYYKEACEIEKVRETMSTFYDRMMKEKDGKK